MSNNLEEIRSAIEDVVRNRFDNIKIERVEVQEGEDHDGDHVFFVKIVFDADLKAFNASRLSGLTRHLRSRLDAIGEDRFPYTRFISSNESHEAAA